jgi:hypothetical protein
MVRVFSAATLLALTVSVVALARTAPPAQPFQQIDGCIYKPQRWNDGDSFHVVLPDQKELVFWTLFRRHARGRARLRGSYRGTGRILWHQL